MDFSHRRKNILTGEWIQVSPHRTKRPWQGKLEVHKEEQLPEYDSNCYLCPGNKRANGTVNPNYKGVYVFDNDFPALQADISETHVNIKDLLVSKSEKGICKVLCFSEKHHLSLAQMELPAIELVINSWAKEYQELGSLDYINAVQIFENKGDIMGCSNPHPHGQIWAQESLPQEMVKEQIQQFNYFKQHNKTLLADYLQEELKQKEPGEIASLMSLSDKLASLNFDRYQSWKAEKKISDNSKPALLVFKGDVYQGLQAEDFKKGDLNFAQKHLRILSGLYGALKPLDVMNPYRLEMGTKLQINGWKNLYEFWGESVKKDLLKDSDTIVNLASNEYYKVLGNISDEAKVVSPVFKDYKNGNYKIISFYAKKARGLMARFIIQNRIKKTDELVDFDLDGYKYSKADSTTDSPVFLRKS